MRSRTRGQDAVCVRRSLREILLERLLGSGSVQWALPNDSCAHVDIISNRSTIHLDTSGVDFETECES